VPCPDDDVSGNRVKVLGVVVMVVVVAVVVVMVVGSPLSSSLFLFIPSNIPSLSL
jgi:hypothetical protein